MKINKYLDKLPSIEGKAILVTGTTSGLGKEVCFHLAYKGAKLIFACRNLDKANLVKEEILKIYPITEISIYKYDQADFKSIDSFVEKIKDVKIDGLIANIGVYYPKKNLKTKDGYELTMGTNYLGTFHLIDKMRNHLNLDKTRVVIVTSLVACYAKKINLDESNKLNRNEIYGYSKRCLARLSYELNSLNEGATYYLAHPGVSSTNIISNKDTGLPNWFGILGHKFLTLFTHSAKKASLTFIRALTSTSINKYISPRGLFHISGYPTERKYPKYLTKPIIIETKEYLENK